MYDVIIVGARCAGSPLAMLMARNDANVLLVDEALLDVPHRVLGLGVGRAYCAATAHPPSTPPRTG